jgi:hypothetical protein
VLDRRVQHLLSATRTAAPTRHELTKHY